MNDFEIGGTDRNGVNPDQDLSARGNGYWLFKQQQLVRVAQHPGFHPVGNGKCGRRLYA
jgi:hypothetical protein